MAKKSAHGKQLFEVERIYRGNGCFWSSRQAFFENGSILCRRSNKYDGEKAWVGPWKFNQKVSDPAQVHGHAIIGGFYTDVKPGSPINWPTPS